MIGPALAGVAFAGVEPGAFRCAMRDPKGLLVVPLLGFFLKGVERDVASFLGFLLAQFAAASQGRPLVPLTLYYLAVCS